MNSAFWRITNKCNLQCRHCCYSCGPYGETTSQENIKKIVNHFPMDLRLVTLTGGEIFTVRSTLMNTLSYIKSKNFPDLKVILQTNGFWVTDPDSTYKILEEVYNLGVRKISFTSDDKYHAEQGLSAEKLKDCQEDTPIRLALEKLKKEKGEDDYPIMTPLRGSSMISPFGRGKSASKKELHEISWCCIRDTLQGEEGVTIDPSGQVYLCCWQMPYSLGSAIESPLDELFEKARKDPVLNIIKERGLGGIVKEFNIHPKSRYSENPCSACEEVFSKLREIERLGRSE